MLAGVPVAIEERAASSPVAERLRAAGAVIAATTGSPAASAAAVAGGAVALAQAADVGGTLRVAASEHGLVGLKPSRFRIPAGPELAELAVVATDGILARTVLDAAVALDAVAGDEHPGPLSLPPPPVPFAAAARTPPERLRIRVIAAAAVQATTEALRDLGHDVEEAEPDWAGDDLDALWEAAIRPAPGSAAALRAFTRRVIGSWPPGSLLLTPTASPFTRAFSLTGQPAITLPPAGVQLAAPVGRESRLLSLAGQLEQAAPWPTAAPPAG